MTGGIALRVNGTAVTVHDEAGSLLDLLRDQLLIHSAKDGCSPQGQCGCCTVLVDGAPRVACVTPVARIAGRDVTTLEGLAPATRDRWVDAFTATGASQCGFCTPGIIMRLSALDRVDDASVGRALLAHLCRCTGWRTIFEAAVEATAASTSHVARDWDRAAQRATIEGGVPQRVGPDVTVGGGGFADDSAPAGALVAVPQAAGNGWATGTTVREARVASGKRQGRRTTASLRWPVDLPDGDWVLTLRTTWVEPAYLESDASWARPGDTGADACANGGAFGGKADASVERAAAALAVEHGRPVRVVLSREDVVRRGPKRPPMAIGVRSDGSGMARVARTPGVADAIRSIAPAWIVEEVDVLGPPTSSALRGAGWAEAAVVLAALTGRADVESPNGARARATIDEDGVHVRVSCGEPMDEIVLRSYCVGAAHMGLGWVTAEGISVDDDGDPLDLTIRSFGIIRATEMPPVDVEIEKTDQPAVNGSDAVFAAVAAAAWIAQGCPPEWPTSRGRQR
ncbi:MAG TPA: 2Fe-2S iron-sulfur cluster-binding protein [Acidimicrobiales bacterium]|nr:2Fe-2S iron-sulfur cluster-binding protein [Acidimicrobiales bacterium]